MDTANSLRFEEVSETLLLPKLYVTVNITDGDTPAGKGYSAGIGRTIASMLCR